MKKYSLYINNINDLMVGTLTIFSVEIKELEN